MGLHTALKVATKSVSHGYYVVQHNHQSPLYKESLIGIRRNLCHFGIAHADNMYSSIVCEIG